MAEIRINSTGGLKLYDADDSHYAQIVAGTITSNVDAITLGHDTVTIADNLSLGSDSAILKLGADGDVTFTHDGTTGLTIAATPISIDATGELHLNSTTGDIKLQDGGTDQIAFDLDGTAGEVIMKPAVDSDDLVISQYDGTEVIRIEDNASLGLVGNKLSIANSSSDVVIKPLTDAKDIIFQQYDGTVVATVEDNATFNIPASKLAIGGTAVTSTAAEMNLLDGGTSVGSSITLADADGVIVNDGGTMKTIPASDFKTYAGGSLVKVASASTLRSSHGDADIQNCFSSTYDVYLVTYAITMDRDGNSFSFKLGTGTNNAAFITSGYNYHRFGYPSDGTSINQRVSDPTSAVQLSDGMMGSTSSIMWSAWGNIMIYRPSSTTEFKPFDFRGAWYNADGDTETISGAGRSDSTTAVTGMRFNPSANYLFSSDVHVYGLET